MDLDDLIILAGGALLVWALYQSQLGTWLESGFESIEAATMGWQNVNLGPSWVPVLNTAEQQYGIPTNLLARQAYQESHFRADVISGATPGGAGELGLMQMLPQYYSSVDVPTPFTPQDTGAQITQAAQLLQSLYKTFGDWGLALAGYNAGESTVQAFQAGTGQLPASTQSYVASILADVPVPSVLTGTSGSLPA